MSAHSLLHKDIKLRLHKTEKKRDTYMQMYEMNWNHKAVSYTFTALMSCSFYLS